MSRELNVGSVFPSDEQGRMIEIVRPNHAKNSLLGIARIPPEILGRIFQFAITDETIDPDFAGIPKDSYKFLLVCHHWHEVARRTPELWCSWGNNLEDWKLWHSRSGTSVLDLVLDTPEYRRRSFDGTLQAALKDRAARGVIRKVHLRPSNGSLSASILSSLTPEDEVIRDSSIESIILCSVDPTNFFARHRFPKLRYLSLLFCPDFALAPLKSHTMALVDLALTTDSRICTSAPTMSQILSLLASNPNLRTLFLRLPAFDDDSKHDLRNPVPLRHLEELSLIGRMSHMFSILERLEFYGTVDQASLVLSDCVLEEIGQVAGPYLRDYLQRDPRFRDKFGVSLKPGHGYNSICVDVFGVGDHGPRQLPRQDPPRASFTMSPPPKTPEEATKMFTDIFKLLPPEKIVYFETEPLDTKELHIEEILVAMPSIEFLHITGARVSDGFLLPKPDGQNANKNLLPSLRRVYLERVFAENDDWGPLIHYLTHQTFDGQSVSLSMFDGWADVCSETVEQLESLVEELYIEKPDSCSEGSESGE